MTYIFSTSQSNDSNSNKNPGKTKLSIAKTRNNSNTQNPLSSDGPQSTNNETKDDRIPLSSVENLAVGAFSGILDVCFTMPILTYKFCLQEGRTLPKSITGWYRGVGVQAGTVAPITAIQFCANGILQQIVRVVRPGEQNGNANLRKLSDGEMMLTSSGAGAISALVYSPVDLLTIQQQKLERNLIDTGRTIMKDYGLSGLYRGLGTCMARELVYTAGYLGLAPVLTARLVKDARLSDRPLLASVLGACIAGTAAGLITHPVDTAKTCIQSDMSGKIWTNLRTTTPRLVRQGGISSLFNGLVPRTVAICGSFFICMTMQDFATDYKTKLTRST